MAKKANKKNAYYAGKFFDTVEEMLDYAAKFPDMPLDLEWFRVFLEQRYQEAAENFAIWEQQGEVFTNRHALLVLKESIIWEPK